MAVSLRERKAGRTRASIVEAGTVLFRSQGFEVTTMGEIAERAEVGRSTLYRYFPTKEDVLLGPFSDRIGRVADLARSRPTDESLAVVLGHVVRAYAAANDAGARELRAIIDVQPVARAKVWDLVAREQARLELALAERCGLDEPDLEMILSARIATALATVAVDGFVGDPRAALARADGLLRGLDPARVVFPRPVDGG